VLIWCKAACILLVAVPSILAQHLDFGMGFGVKGGTSFTDLLETTGAINPANTALKRSTDYLIGPVVELRIPFGFALEVDGLYRKSEYSLTANNVTSTIPANAWEIPYLAKFRFPIPLLKPFVSAGGAYRTFTDLPPNVTPTHNAFVVAGGLELRLSRIRLSAEGRWLRWGSTSTGTGVRPAQNQGEVLFGFIF
jgi:hypothetical protein